MQELGLENAWVSELIFWCLFIPFILWSFSPFVTARKRFYTAVIYARILMVLTLCQILRIISFTSTQLPAPNYHCRLNETTAIREPADKWWNHVVVDVGRQATHGCGDLIFSSHTTFVLVGCLTFTEYGETLILKIIAWIGVGLMSLCIIASRKHYSVDVVIAWYVVPLVFYTMLRRWTTKRPVQDYWPHRPLGGEEGNEPASLQAAAIDNKVSTLGPENKPLLPIVVQMAANGEEGMGNSNANGSAGLNRQVATMKTMHRSNSSAKLNAKPSMSMQSTAYNAVHGRASLNPSKSSKSVGNGLDVSIQESTGVNFQGPQNVHQRRPSTAAINPAGGTGDLIGTRPSSAANLEAVNDIESGRGTVNGSAVSLNSSIGTAFASTTIGDGPFVNRGTSVHHTREASAGIGSGNNNSGADECVVM